MANGSMMKRVRQITGLVGTGLIATMLPLVAYAETEIGAKLDPALVASKIYERYTDQQTRSSQQDLRILSRDPGGSEQVSRFEMRIQDERDNQGKPKGRVRYRLRIDVSAPFDLRHTKYLIIGNDPGPNEEFIYAPSTRRVRRADLSKTSFLGTDYTFGDFMVQDVNDADHKRLPDEVIDGQPVYVVESILKEGIKADYRKTVAYVEPEHFVPLRTRSWDDYDVEVKEMTAKAASIRSFGDVWVSTESKVRDLQRNTESVLFVEKLNPKPKFNRSTFSPGRLARGK
jgi:hypothetical protein